MEQVLVTDILYTYGIKSQSACPHSETSKETKNCWPGKMNSAEFMSDELIICLDKHSDEWIKEGRPVGLRKLNV